MNRRSDRTDETSQSTPDDDPRSRLIVRVMRTLLGLAPVGEGRGPAAAREASTPSASMLCERCGTRMTLLTQLPATTELPSVGVYECPGCEIIDLMRDAKA